MLEYGNGLREAIAADKGGRLLEAEAAYRRILLQEPRNADALNFLGMLTCQTGNPHAAAELLERSVESDPTNPMALHLLAASTGEGTPARANDGYIRQLFDDFAASFDENLQALRYRAPELIADRLTSELAAHARHDILDAGCGTGLCGPLLRPRARRLIGVDLSAGMVEKAQARGVYDELVVEELSHFMRGRPRSFDVVASADTLVYFGALEEPLAAARQCLRPAGVLTFTVERLDPSESSERYRLRPHGRYSHCDDYLRSAVKAAGFGRVVLEPAVLRRERGADVAGVVVTAKE